MGGSWVYLRADERLEVHRRDRLGGADLLLTGPDGVRQRHFDDLESLFVFHGLFERALLQAGWTFAGYRPGRPAWDRRSAARAPERRLSLLQVLLKSAAPHPAGPSAAIHQSVNEL